MKSAAAPIYQFLSNLLPTLADGEWASVPAVDLPGRAAKNRAANVCNTLKRYGLDVQVKSLPNTLCVRLRPDPTPVRVSVVRLDDVLNGREEA